MRQAPPQHSHPEELSIVFASLRARRVGRVGGANDVFLPAYVNCFTLIPLRFEEG
jgi:hypothetical protein